MQSHCFSHARVSGALVKGARSFITVLSGSSKALPNACPKKPSADGPLWEACLVLLSSRPNVSQLKGDAVGGQYLKARAYHCEALGSLASPLGWASPSLCKFEGDKSNCIHSTGKIKVFCTEFNSLLPVIQANTGKAAGIQKPIMQANPHVQPHCKKRS